MTNLPLSGIFAAVLTPIHDDGSIDLPSLASHAASLLDKGCHGVSLFGTTGEGPAFTAEERMQGLEAVLAAGVPADKIMPGTGAAALPDTVALTRHALEKGCNTVLLMPPFFFKDLANNQVLAFFEKCIEEVNDPNLKVVLYNFPAVTGVLITPDVIAQLAERYPSTIVGVKDSSGDWDYVTSIRKLSPDVALFTGWEALVPKLLAAGGVGNISGIANIAPDILRDLFDRAPQDPEDACLKGVEKLVAAVTKYPVTPALKSLKAKESGAKEWRNLRVPNLPLSAEQEAELFEAVAEARAVAGF